VQPKPIVLPYPSIGDLFKGRDEFLRTLNESLKRGRHAAIISHALYGLGGIGKTRAAVEYAWAHQNEYSALLFVVAETSEILRRNLAALASKLMPKLDTTDDAERLKAVVDWLRATPGWYLILDNVDTKAALAEVEGLLSGLAGGHVIITSLLKDYSGNFRPLELGVLAIDDAVAFLQARTEGRRRNATDDDAKAREVARELDGLALALEQAAAFIAKRELTFGQYLKKWRSSHEEVLGWFDSTVTGYPRAVAATWQTSVTQLTQSGQQLLERLAWFAPEKVPEFLLDVPILDNSAKNLYDALDDLAAYSLVTRAAEGPFFLIHRLVQDVTRRKHTDDVRRYRLNEALTWISAAFAGDPNDASNWPRLDPLASHAQAVAMYADNNGIADPTAALMNRLGQLFHTKALLAEAEPLMRRALAIDENIHGQDHPLVARQLNNLAQLLKATNRFAEAEPLMRRALAIDEEQHGPDHPEVATDLNNLAVLLHDTGRLVDAEPLIRRALKIDERSYGSDHPNVAIRLSNLALLLKTTKRLEEAESSLRRALAILEKTYGPEHAGVATALNNLGILLHQNKQLVEAEPLIRRALVIGEKIYGPLHPTVAIRLNNLARLLQDDSRLNEAEPLMRRHVAIFVEFTRKTGHPHPHLKNSFQNYTRLLSDMGKSPIEIQATIEILRRHISPLN
jgi:tetratricopeptide (TPR) repeat protein